MHDPGAQFVVPCCFTRIVVCCQRRSIGVMAREAVWGGLVSRTMEFRVEYSGFFPEGPLYVLCDYFALPVRKCFGKDVCDPGSYRMTTGRLLVSQ